MLVLLTNRPLNIWGLHAVLPCCSVYCTISAQVAPGAAVAMAEFNVGNYAWFYLAQTAVPGLKIGRYRPAL
jgi:hypothetical protein